MKTEEEIRQRIADVYRDQFKAKEIGFRKMTDIIPYIQALEWALSGGKIETNKEIV